jgi:glycosyltransferase involved in cell wall biosynthesis
MLLEPVVNDPQNPLISLLIYNYDASCLRSCFDEIFAQQRFRNIELIFIDDASSDGGWVIALEYFEKYSNVITLTRNRMSCGQLYNKANAMRMSRGRYYVLLHSKNNFIPENVEQCINVIDNNISAEFPNVGSITRIKQDYLLKNDMERVNTIPAVSAIPLVSFCIFNYNYGRYLRACIESVFSQTHENIEICFSDNASTDDSWEIALEYVTKYPGKMQVTRNRKNFGSDANFANCFAHVRGKYFVELCSDDALMPDFTKRCVDAMEAHLEAGYAMVHRTIIDEHDHRTEEPPFYNMSCVIPGPEQAAVYMMAAVNPCISQVMYHTTKVYGKSAVGGIAARWYGTRLHDFNMCCDYSMVYIKEPLLLNRIHSQNDSCRASDNLLEIIGPYVLQHQYADIASHNPHLSKVVERLKPSIDKLAFLCLRYCVRLLGAGQEATALRYYHLSAAINPEICTDPVFRILQELWTANAEDKSGIVLSLSSENNLATRMVSYDPPPGSIAVQLP